MNAKPNKICPLCGGPNGCGPALSGDLETECWCTDATIDPAALARIPEAQRRQVCICRRCATGVSDSAPEVNKNRFSEPEIQGVYRAIRERRDMRHFLPKPVEPEQLARFIEAAHLGPSVGYMQPWRFIRIVNPELRKRIHQHVDEERMLTAAALGQRADEFMRLKVEGILTCAEVLVVGLIDKRDAYVFGRRTMPEMDLASASCAIQNFWLAARAEGIGAGWVSMFDPARLRALCNMPEGSQPIAILCVGHVEEFYPAPMLEIEGWDQRRPLKQMMFEDSWE